MADQLRVHDHVRLDGRSIGEPDTDENVFLEHFLRLLLIGLGHRADSLLADESVACSAAPAVSSVSSSSSFLFLLICFPQHKDQARATIWTYQCLIIIPVTLATMFG